MAYISKYGKDLDDLATQVAQYQDYDSKYGGNIADTQQKLVDNGEYKSQYTDKINNATSGLENMGVYKSTYMDSINNTLNQLQNRQFSYDPEKDETYQQYAKSYTDAGNQAMEDTIGKLSARTGGLASSYGAAAANNQYNQYMKQLADKIPELKQLAYNMYQGETNNLNNLLGNYFNAENNARADYQTNQSYYNNLISNYLNLDQNAQNVWNANNNYYNNLLSNYLNMDANDRNIWNDNRNSIIDRLNTLTGVDQVDYGRWLDEQQLAQAAASRGGGGGSGYGGYPSLDELMALLNQQQTQTVPKPGVASSSQSKALDLPSGNGNSKNTSILNRTVNRNVTDARTGNGASSNQLSNYNEIVGMLKNGNLTKTQKTDIINRAESILSPTQIKALKTYL